jgi:hypothetical protein
MRENLNENNIIRLANFKCVVYYILWLNNFHFVTNDSILAYLQHPKMTLLGKMNTTYFLNDRIEGISKYIN